MRQQSEAYTHAGSGSVLEPPIISIEQVGKRFNNVVALREVSLVIERGEMFGLLGPNGAGKSTLLKLLLGFLRPDEGGIRLFGSTDLTRAHARLGYLPERPRYHGNFTGREYLRFHAGLEGLEGNAKRAADGVLEAVGLGGAANRRIKTYSKGMLQRLGLAVALLNGKGEPPELLVLDEPASGLDPEGQVAIRDLILDCKRRGSTVLLCSHQLTEVERICSHVGVLRGGRLVTKAYLAGSQRVNITGVPRNGAVEIASYLIEYLRKLDPGVRITGGQSESDPLHVSLPTGDDASRAAAIKAAALKAMIDGRWDITSVHIESKELETLYLQAVQPPVPAPEKSADGATPPASISLSAPTQEAHVESSRNGQEATSVSSGPHTTPLPLLPADVEMAIRSNGSGNVAPGSSETQEATVPEAVTEAIAGEE